MRGMGQPGNHHKGRERVDVPDRIAQILLPPHGDKADRTDGDYIAEGQDKRRQENRHQQQWLQHMAAGHIGAGHQKGQQGPQRNRNGRHPHSQHGRGPQSPPEIGLLEHKLIRPQRQLRLRIEERRRQKALIGDQKNRGQNKKGRDRNHDPTSGGASNCTAHFLMAACHWFRNSRRLVCSSVSSNSRLTGMGRALSPKRSSTALAVSLPSTSPRIENNSPLAIMD